MDEAKQKEFLKDMIEQRKWNCKIFKPSTSYDLDYDIFFFWFGGKKKVEHTIELNSDIRLDMDSDDNVVGIEIEGVSKLLEKSNQTDITSE